MWIRIGMVALLAGLWPKLVLPADGILEINQACAENAGCFPGDGPGFPVTLTKPGSYRFTSNLTFSGAAAADLIAVSIEASDVTLDLGGFRIACSIFTPPSTVGPCHGAGHVGEGIVVDDVNTRSGVEVRNGSIVGMALNGIRLGDRSVVRAIRAHDNGVVGIHVGAYSRVLDNTVTSHGLDGLIVSDGSLVKGNLAHDNRIGLVVGGPNSAYRENVSTGNYLAAVDAVGPANNLGDNFCSGVNVGAPSCP